MKPALILIDIQLGFRDLSWGPRNNPEFETNISRLLEHWRKIGGDIYHVQHLSVLPNSPLRPGQRGVELESFGQPRGQEKRLTKTVNSAFIGTPLKDLLTEAGHRKIVIAGLSTDHCISTSCRMASNLGFEVMLPADATATFPRRDHRGILHSADLVHDVALASLDREFAQVTGTKDVIKAQGPRAAAGFDLLIGRKT